MSIRILIIDPDRQVARSVRRSLALQGYDVATAHDAAAGLQCVRDFAPAIVITEVVMPDKDGIECLIDIKREAPSTKVVAMSGGGELLKSRYVLHLASQLGADGVLMKPFTHRQLAQAIQSVLPEAPPRPPGEDER